MTSVNTNASATTALRTLQQTNKALDTTQNRISTGLKIGEAKDNAAYWAISTTLKSDNKSLSTVKDALGLGAATVDTAYQGLNKAKEVLDQIKSKLTSATQDGLDRNVIQDEVKALQDQLKSIATSSIFSGENWLSVDSSVAGYNSGKEIVASFSRDAKGAVSIGTVAVDTTTIKLYDSSTTANGILDGGKALKAADGTALTVGGTDATGSAPSLQSLTATSATAGIVTAGPVAATNTFGTINRTNLQVNDRITFNLSLNGAAVVPVKVTVDATAKSSDANFVAAINTGLGNAGVTGLSATDVGGVITLTTTATGSGASINVTNVAALDGDGVAIVQSTATGGLLGTSLTTGGAATPSRITFAPAAPADTPDANDYIEFDFRYGSETYRGRMTGPATHGTVATYASELDAAVRAALNVNTGTAFNASAGSADVTITVDPDVPANVLVQTVGKGADKLVSFQNINSYKVTGTTVGVGTVGVANVENYNTGLIAGTAGTSTAAVLTAGAYAAGSSTLAQGDRITFNATLSTAGGGTNAPIAVSVNTTGVTSLTTFQTAVQSALDVALGTGKVIVGQNGGNTALTFTTAASGENVAFGISGVLGVDGDGATAANGGLTAGTATGTAATTAAAAFTQTNSTFTGPMTFDDQDTVTFDVAVDGGTAKKVTINKAIISTALTTTDGVVSSAANYATVINTAFTAAGVTGLTASDSSGFIKIAKSTPGTGTVAVSNAVASSGGDTISVDTINISDTALTTAGVTTAAQRKAVLSAYITVVNEAINSITTAAAKLGAVASRIELQNSFVDTLMDTIDKGVGNLVDADLSEESTRLQALQTKQQLGVQALSIANSGTQNILRLFQ
ncbi:hypothetical protein ASG43_12870 [Aureimonas sp. Leaf454]|uniref:flagellin N-terminal helical domain-containing protein n=1 Tax=Aureimonas sp. Leaf454 TaxID=1736381 RepID=UPI0007012A49|nr:flagellin [Aureimonas sp. Leaf454]KQT45180.1 hypothetical protein ASG43_12870 [Aureimonas sp. Leaf454]